MQVSVEKISNIERRLTIIIPANQVEEAFSKQLNQLAKNVKVKGFRPGKAPLSYIKQRFGADARKEALNEVIEQSLYQALQDQNLKPVSIPKVEPTKGIQDNEPFEFVASFEVLPEIGKIEFATDNIEKLHVEVSDADVDRVLLQLQKQYSKWQEVDHTARDGNRVVIDYYAIFEGKEELDDKVQGFPLELGSKVMLPGIEEGLIGAKAGEKRTLNLQFPADFSVSEKAGKPVDFVVEVKLVFEAHIPIVDETFIKQLGISSGKEEELKAQIKHSLEQEKDRLLKDKLKEQMFQRLFEQNQVEVPKALIEREVKHIHDEIYPKDEKHDHNHSEEELSAFREVAKKRVALGLLIAEYAKQVDIKVDKERVLKRIQEIASAYEQPREVSAWLSSDENRPHIEAQVLEEQVLEKLMEGVTVIDKNMSYAELKGIR